MAKHNSVMKNIGIILIIAAALMYIPIPFMGGIKNLASLTVLVCGIYMVVKG